MSCCYCHKSDHLLLQVTRLPVLPELCIFLTNRFLPYPVVLPKVKSAVRRFNCLRACIVHSTLALYGRVATRIGA